MTAEGPTATVYCGACGAALSGSAKFCRACGSPQDAFAEDKIPAPDVAPTRTQMVTEVQPAPAAPSLAPPPPVAVTLPWTQSRQGGAFASAILAIAGGAGMFLMVLYTIVYFPLHHHYSVNFGEPLQFGDLLALGSAAAAIVIGVMAIRTRPTNPMTNGIALILAGVPTLLLACLWAYPETFHLAVYPQQPFYFGLVYFSDFGQAHIGGSSGGYVQVPLVISCAAVTLAGILMAVSSAGRQQPRSWQ